MFQRLESMKKYAFGLMYIFGGEGDQRLAGIWLGRGGNNFFYVSRSYFLTDLNQKDSAIQICWLILEHFWNLSLNILGNVLE